MGQDGARFTLDFNNLISERTRNFAGREWVFQEIDDWLANPAGHRFFLLTGEPGSGKTAIASRLAQFSHGQFSPPQDLDQLAPGCLSAMHFCSARDRRWTNPHVFTESLALQLSARYPAYAKALADKSADRRLNINVEQRVQEVASGGEVSGVVMVIKNLNVGAVSPEDAFILVVREPLEAIFHDGHNEQVVILVDALDEARSYSGDLNIVSLLAQAENLPAGVRFIITSRPEQEMLRPLRRAGQERRLTSKESLDRNLGDVSLYVRDALNERRQLTDKLAPGLALEDFVAAISDKSEGNFLYVHNLLQMLEEQSAQISHQALEEWPVGLDDIYLDFLGRLKDVDKVWSEQYKPVLGTLGVAQQALSEKQLSDFVGIKREQVREALNSLGQLLEVDETLPATRRAYVIYHLSFADFLLNEDRAERYWCEEKEQHKRIADFYSKGFRNNWQGIDAYGLNYLATHLYESGNHEQLQCLISKPWMDARYAGGGYIYKGFLDDVNLAWQTGLAKENYDVLTLVRLRTARQAVTQQVSLYTDIDLKTLVWLGRKQEALAHARLRTEAAERFRGLVSIYEAVRESEQADIDLLNEAEEVASAIPYDERRAEALRDLAAAMAQAGHFAQAEETARATAYDVERDEALGDLAAAIARAEEKARSVRYDEERDKVWSGLAAAMAQAGHFAQAEETARSITGRRQRAKVLRDLAAAMARAGESRASEVFAQAEETARSIRRDEQRDEALRDLAAALAQAGHFTKAEEMARSITDYGERTKALSKLAAALAQAGRFDQALTTLSSRSLDEFMNDLASWAPAFEQRKSGLSVAVLREATGVAGWVSSDWRKIHELLSAPG
jgi:hypothetical protein